VEASFWHERWQQNQIGFHQPEINPHLQQFWPGLGLPADSTVFVPLCGKSADMLWLRAQDYRVVGVELSPMAVDAFFSENRLQPDTWQEDGFTVSEADGIRLYCGDYFALRPQHLSGAAGAFDRAALMALPPAMRADYAQHLRRLLPRPSRILLVVFDYPQQEMAGPPFSVSEADVRALYGQEFAVERLHAVDVLAQEPWFRDKGLTQLQEKVYRLTA